MGIGAIIGAIAGTAGSGQASALQAKYKGRRAKEERSESEAARRLQLGLYEESKIPGAETSSPEQIALRKFLLPFLQKRLGSKLPPSVMPKDFTNLPSFARGKSAIERRSTTSRSSLRGVPGLPAGAFAKGQQDIDMGTLRALSQLIGTTQEQELGVRSSERTQQIDFDQRQINDIIRAITMGVPRVNAPVPNITPHPSSVTMSPLSAFWSSVLQGKGASQGVKVGGGGGGGQQSGNTQGLSGYTP